MIHLITWLPLPYQQTLCRTLYRAYGEDFVVWFGEREHKEFPFHPLSTEEFPSHYLSEEGYLKLFRALRCDPEAVVILGGWRSPMANKTILMRMLLRIPILIWADHPHPRARRRLVEYLRRMYLRFIARQAMGFLACGAPTVEHLASFGIDRERITSFPYWTEIPQEWSVPKRCVDPNAARQPLRLIAIGRLVSVKQFDVAIAALGLVNQKAGHKLAELLIVGDGPERASLEQMSRSLDCESAITFSGWLEGDEVNRQLNSSDALVLPSKFEPYGVVVLEAMAAGRAVLASTGVVAALDRDEGTGAVRLHPIGQIESLAEQIALLATEPEQLRKASLSARATAEKWPPERAIAILDEVLGKFQKDSGLPARYKSRFVSRAALKLGR